MVGCWQFTDNINNAVWTLQNQRSSEFDVLMTLDEAGSFEEVYRERLSLKSTGRQNTISEWERVTGNLTKAVVLASSQLLLNLNVYSAEKSGIGLYEEVLRLRWEHVRGDTNGELPDPRFTTSQTWAASKSTIGLELEFEMTFGLGPDYRLTATMKDSGKLKAENGQFSVLTDSRVVY